MCFFLQSGVHVCWCAWVFAMQELGIRVGGFRTPAITGVAATTWAPPGMPLLRLCGDAAQASGGITYDRVVALVPGHQQTLVQLAPSQPKYNYTFTNSLPPGSLLKVSQSCWVD